MLKGIFMSGEIKFKLIKPKSELGEAQLCQSRLSLGEILSAKLWRAQLYESQFWSRLKRRDQNCVWLDCADHILAAIVLLFIISPWHNCAST